MISYHQIIPTLLPLSRALLAFLCQRGFTTSCGIHSFLLGVGAPPRRRHREVTFSTQLSTSNLSRMLVFLGDLLAPNSSPDGILSHFPTLSPALHQGSDIQLQGWDVIAFHPLTWLWRVKQNACSSFRLLEIFLSHYTKRAPGLVEKHF